MGKLGNLKTEHIALLSMIVFLVITGISIFLWMAAAGWEDKVGIIVGIKFLVLGGLEILFTFFWWRRDAKTQSCRFDGEGDEQELKLKMSSTTNNTNTELLAAKQVN